METVDLLGILWEPTTAAVNVHGSVEAVLHAAGPGTIPFV